MLCDYGARFAKQGKVALERNYLKAPMGGENSAGDLLTMLTLKNTDTTSHFHNDQRNLPRAAQITGCFKTCFFWPLNNGANASNLTSANVSKSRCVIHFNTLLP